MLRKICLLSDHHLCVNPRLWKEAFFYEKEGFEVVIITMWQSRDLLRRDFEILNGHAINYKTYLNLIPGEINSLVRFFYRLRKRVGSELQRLLKIGTGWAISHGPHLMFQKALKEEADLYAAHLECAFFVGRNLIKAGKKVSFDFEDWYSRDYLTADRAVKLLSRLEAFALKQGIFCTAASKSMADALIETYPGAHSIAIIYNSFPDDELDDITITSSEKNDFFLRLIWTSRTVGPGRGLETLLESLKLLTHPIELHIIGKCSNSYKGFLREIWPSFQGHRLILHDFIRHAELLPQISTYDIGLAIERYKPESRNKTITNKILQYLQAGIRVLSTDTDGQKEVAAFFPESVFLVSPDQPEQWKDRLESFIANRDFRNRSEQLKTFKAIFSWAVQEEKLKRLISEIV